MKIVASEPDRVLVLQALLLRHDEKAKKIIAKLEELAIHEHGAMYGLLDSARDDWQGEQEVLMRSLDELGESARSELRRHLTLEQVQVLEGRRPADAASKIGPNAPEVPPPGTRDAARSEEAATIAPVLKGGESMLAACRLSSVAVVARRCARE